jgi:hypothetical protein
VVKIPEIPKIPEDNVLEGKISWEHGNISSRLTIQFKHDFLSYLTLQKIAAQCSHVDFSYFIMGSHLGQ